MAIFPVLLEAQNLHFNKQNVHLFSSAPGSTSYTPAQGAYNYGTPQRAPGYPDQSGYPAASQTYPGKLQL